MDPELTGQDGRIGVEIFDVMRRCFQVEYLERTIGEGGGGWQDVGLLSHDRGVRVIRS